LVQIHERSLEVLSSVGVRVDAEWARKVLSDAGGTPADDPRTIRLSREVIEWAIKAAPPSVDIYDRLGKAAFRLGKDRARFGAGVTTLYYQDIDAAALEPFARRHMELLVRLCDGLSAFDVVSTLGIVQDVPPRLSDLYAVLDMVANTTKPLVVLVSDEGRFPAVLDLLEHLSGDLSARPFVIPYVNPITPLRLSEGTADKMRQAIERGLPLIFSSYGMAGATTPISPSASWALLNAELLAGLTLAQLIKKRTPVVLGFLPAYFDMRGTGSYYDMTSYLLNLACAEMMSWYGLPHCGTSGSGMGRSADLVTAAHQWANHLTSCASNVGLVPFVGDVLGSKAFSPEALIYASEVITHARRFAQGLPLENPDTGLSEIASVGAGGSFMTTSHTLERHRSASFFSAIFANLSLEEWQRKAQPRADGELRAYVRELMSNLKPPTDHDRLIGRGESFIRRLADGT
jgi:trimethylamine--corrinoid protein Co-methyltransferase